MSSSAQPAEERDRHAPTGNVCLGEEQQQQQQLPADIGEDQKPGQAEDGTVLDCIETAIQRRIAKEEQLDSTEIDLKHWHTWVSDFPVVQNEKRKVCTYYVSRCINYYSKRYRNSIGEGSVAASSSPTVNKSQTPSRRSSETDPSSVDGAQPSSLGLDDLRDTIEIPLPNNKPQPVVFVKRNGHTTYIRPEIVERCGLGGNPTPPRLVIDLRFTTIVNNRGKVYRVSGCSFRVKPGLEADLAIGWDLQEKLQQQSRHTEYSYDMNNSLEDSASIDGREKPTSVTGRNEKTFSHAGSSRHSPTGTATSKDFLDLAHRILDMDMEQRSGADVNVHRDQHRHHSRYGRQHSPSPGPSSGGRRHRPRERGHDSEPSTEARPSRRRRT
ncbi:hypothetical protein JX265_010892 [Neoarthrinium moseri]|uniref:Uncharacterized protein n=1 Tax=Neoarthrinium moseri TaxID=1658444 RepID=A0A9P9WDL9_9PEZI|nr:hypothetical protein JX265_010892 [Neoarthrinium moseri]